MSYRLGDTIHAAFRKTDATGAAADADALPTGAVLQNGVASATAVTIVDRGIGLYDAHFDATVVEGFAAGDAISISIDATIGGIATGGVISDCVLASALEEVVTALLSGWTICDSAVGTIEVYDGDPAGTGVLLLTLTHTTVGGVTTREPT